MTSSLVVLTDFFAVSNRALSYAAALAVPLEAELVLLHVRYDGLPVPDGFSDRHTHQQELRTEQALRRLAAAQTLPTEIDVAEGFLPAAVAEAVRRHRPLLLVLSRPSLPNSPPEALTNVVMDLLYQAPHPLLLIPALGMESCPPRRLLLAVDGQPFTLLDEHDQHVLRRLLAATLATLAIVHVTDDEHAAPTGSVWQTVQDSGLADATGVGMLQELYNPTVVDGILEEAARQQADMLVLVARHYSLLGGLFHHSITAQLLQESHIPVLLLPAQN